MSNLGDVAEIPLCTDIAEGKGALGRTHLTCAFPFGPTMRFQVCSSMDLRANMGRAALPQFPGTAARYIAEEKKALIKTMGNKYSVLRTEYILTLSGSSNGSAVHCW